MKIILLGKSGEVTRVFNIGAAAVALFSLCIACVVGAPAAGYYAYLKATERDASDLITPQVADAWAARLAEQAAAVAASRSAADNHLAALALRVAELQARMVRIDALGERLTTMAKLEDGEFDFSQPPAMGGPEGNILEASFAPPGIVIAIDDLARQIDDRQLQLDTLESLLVNRKLEDERFVAGRPIVKGWMSSRYGRRTDPFTGKLVWHDGVDFAGRDGSDIIAVAAGVVTWSGYRAGYGHTVEINHGNGFETRYAHCKENLVKVGDVVKKGQIIALMGSTGRSTGPHVHFEVFKNGRVVDPATYIHRASR